LQCATHNKNKGSFYNLSAMFLNVNNTPEEAVKFYCQSLASSNCQFYILFNLQNVISKSWWHVRKMLIGNSGEELLQLNGVKISR